MIDHLRISTLSIKVMDCLMGLNQSWNINSPTQRNTFPMPRIDSAWMTWMDQDKIRVCAKNIVNKRRYVRYIHRHRICIFMRQKNSPQSSASPIYPFMEWAPPSMPSSSLPRSLPFTTYKFDRRYRLSTVLFFVLCNTVVIVIPILLLCRGMIREGWMNKFPPILYEIIIISCHISIFLIW